MSDLQTLDGEESLSFPSRAKPQINDYELIRVIGRGSFGKSGLLLMLPVVHVPLKLYTKVSRMKKILERI